MSKIENYFNKTCSPNLILIQKLFSGRLSQFWTKKLTLKTENVKLLTSLPQVILQDIKKSFKGAYWSAKVF